MKNNSALYTYFDEAEGSEIRIEESLRFLLHDPHSLALVQEGSLDIFAINLQGDLLFTSKEQMDELALNTTPFIADLLEGTLIYLGTVNAGDLLFQFPFCSDLESLRILAIAVTPLKLKKTSFRVFQKALHQNPALVLETDAQIHKWISIFDHLLNSGNKGFVQPTPLELHAAMQFPKGTLIGHSKVGTSKEKNQVLWVQSQEGDLGVELPSSEDADYYLIKAKVPPYPLTLNVNLLCLEDCKVESFSLQDLVEKNLVMWAILSFHQSALQWLNKTVKVKQAAEISLFRRRNTNDQALLKNALENASQILEMPEPFGVSESSDPLFRACELIGDREKIQFHVPTRPLRTRALEERLAEICRFSHVNFRNVFLGTDWWRKTDGYILCFSKANEPLVAHCNIGRHSAIIDPQSLIKTPLNETTAAQLKSGGYIFYRNFPEISPLSIKDLIRFIFFKKGREIRTILLCGFLAVLVALFIPYATNVIFDQVIPTLDSSLLLQIGLAMVISVVSTALFQLTKEYTLNRMLSVIDVQLMAAVWDRVLNLKAHFFRKYEIGDLYLRIQGISEMAKQIAGNPLRILLNVLFSALYLFSMFYYSPALSVIGLLVIGTISSITFIFILKNIPIQKQILEIKSFTNSKVIEFIQAITKIRTSGVSKRAFSYWLQNFNVAKNLEKQQQTTQNIISTLLTFAPNLAYFLILSYIIYTLNNLQPGLKSSITVGSLMAFLAAYAPFSDSVFEALTTLVELQILKPLWDRAKCIFEEPLERDSTKTKLSNINGAIRFEHVSFRYSPETPFVLKDINFEIQPGEFIGIVGLSGAGKSSLIRLITGLETPERGEIFIDNHSLKNLDVQDFRRQISTVLQQEFILSGSIREFLSSGNHYSDQKLIQALTDAGFAEDLTRLPMGLNTVLVNGAGTFSGGQRQRLILAKALVSNPKILLLDEATSALDNQTQELVKRNLDIQQITRVVVAHRLSTVRMADRIYVLDDGLIADSGTFDELSAKMGLFSVLLAKQKG